MLAIHCFLGANQCLKVDDPAIATRQFQCDAVRQDTASNPPTKTNSTCASTSLRISSLRLCIPFLHRDAERIGELQRIIIDRLPMEEPRRTTH
jgi:hypothetical protein